ncbi:hypothetical protein ACNKHS_23250 [Shigella flexneri]
MPDAPTRAIHPFYEEPTLIIRCNSQNQARCKAMTVTHAPSQNALKSTAFYGIRRHRSVRARASLFLFDDIRFGASISGSHVAIDDIEGA